MEAGSMITFFAGLDLGQAHDSTAIALLEREVDRGRTHYSLRHLQRWPPGSSYPRIAEEVSQMLRAVPRCGLRLVVDQTAVGRAVATLFNRNNSVSTREVLISAGHAVTSSEDGCTHVPKKELVSVLQMLLQTQRLKIAAGLSLAEALSREMALFRASVKVASGAEEVTWREREHDDLVLEVALAAWEGERNPPSVGIPLILGERGWRSSCDGW
jgi:hypothetical protein